VHKPTLAILTIVLASCAAPGERGHHGGDFGGRRMSESMEAGAQYSLPAHPAHRAGTANADAILFAGFDRDGDLLITQAEVEAGIAREFARADANHDGLISPEEYQAWSLRALGGAYAPYRTDMDRNGDGQITFAEFAAELRQRAHDYDSNGDGVIERADLVRGSTDNDELQVLSPHGANNEPGEDQGQTRRRRRSD